MKLKKLEALRGFAALYVVANHIIALDFVKRSVPEIERLPFRFGQEVVMMFFLLSGFVIYLSVHLSESKDPNTNFPKYLLKRFVRIYPILISAFILSAIAALINGYHFTLNDARLLICNIFMMQDINKPDNTVLPFLDNYPLWTLSYECGFYLMFYPIYVLFIKSKTVNLSSTYVVLFMSMCAWLVYMLSPNHILIVIAYFSLWWTGVACAQIYLQHKTFNFTLLKPVILSLIVMTLFTSIPTIKAIINNEYYAPADYPVIVVRHYATALLMILGGLAWWRINLKGFDYIFGAFGRFAPISYALYVIHYVFIHFNTTSVHPFAVLTIELAMAFLTAYLLEIKLQPLFNKIFFPKKTNKPTIG